MIYRREMLAIMKAHRHLRLVWPPPPKNYRHPGRSIAVMGPTGAGKTTLVAALAGELLWCDEHLTLIKAAKVAQDSLSA